MGRRERERGRESGWIYVHIAMRIFTESRNYPSRVIYILSARLLWQPKLFLDKGKDREMRDTRWMKTPRMERSGEDRREV